MEKKIKLRKENIKIQFFLYDGWIVPSTIPFVFEH